MFLEPELTDTRRCILLCSIGGFDEFESSWSWEEKNRVYNTDRETSKKKWSLKLQGLDKTMF